MDKEKAVSNFLKYVESLSGLPLITDSEVNELFGEEVASVLVVLNRYGQKGEICLHCDSRCCKIARCELYAPQFEKCPIHDFRPVVCRLHFCHKFAVSDNSMIKEIGDIFFDSLIAADRDGSQVVRMFDNPPLGESCPDLVKTVSPWVYAVREGSLNPENTIELINLEAEKYKSSGI
ncbi:hypothetical protein ACFLUP_01520 [Chloroflexota bacterium]